MFEDSLALFIYRWAFWFHLQNEIQKKKFNQNFDWQRGIQFSAFKAISSWQLLSNLNNSLGSKFSAYSKNISHAKKKTWTQNKNRQLLLICSQELKRYT